MSELGGRSVFLRIVVCFVCFTAIAVGQTKTEQNDPEPFLKRFWVGMRGGGMINSSTVGQNIEESTTATNPPQSHFRDGSSESSHFVFGPTVGFNLSERWTISADILYRRAGYDSSDVLKTQPDDDGDTDFLYGTYERTRIDYWDVPILVRYYATPPGGDSISRPYITGGPAFRRAVNLKTFNETVDDDGYRDTSNIAATPAHSTVAGAAFGAGLHLSGDSPVQADFEVRATRWFERTFDSPLIRSNLNQIECLMSITF